MIATVNTQNPELDWAPLTPLQIQAWVLLPELAEGHLQSHLHSRRPGRQYYASVTVGQAKVDILPGFIGQPGDATKMP